MSTVQPRDQITTMLEQIRMRKQATEEPGSTGGATTHPVKSVDDGTQEATTGARASENASDIKANIAMSVDSTEGTEGESGHPVDDIGTKTDETGDNVPGAAGKADSDTGGGRGKTSHPANTQFGEKYGSLKEAAESILAGIVLAVKEAAEATPVEETPAEATSEAATEPEAETAEPENKEAEASSDPTQPAESAEEASGAGVTEPEKEAEEGEDELQRAALGYELAKAASAEVGLSTNAPDAELFEKQVEDLVKDAQWHAGLVSDYLNKVAMEDEEGDAPSDDAESDDGSQYRGEGGKDENSDGEETAGAEAEGEPVDEAAPDLGGGVPPEGGISPAELEGAPEAAPAPDTGGGLPAPGPGMGAEAPPPGPEMGAEPAPEMAPAPEMGGEALPGGGGGADLEAVLPQLLQMMQGAGGGEAPVEEPGAPPMGGEEPSMGGVDPGMIMALLQALSQQGQMPEQALGQEVAASLKEAADKADESVKESTEFKTWVREFQKVIGSTAPKGK